MLLNNSLAPLFRTVSNATNIARFAARAIGSRNSSSSQMPSGSGAAGGLSSLSAYVNGDVQGANNDYSYAANRYLNEQEITNAQNTNLIAQRNMDAANTFAANQAEIERDFIREQRSNAYQVAMADMKAAGLNPILAYSQGGASVSSAGAASPSMAGATNPQMHEQQIDQTSARSLTETTQTNITKLLSTFISSAAKVVASDKGGTEKLAQVAALFL